MSDFKTDEISLRVEKYNITNQNSRIEKCLDAAVCLLICDVVGIR